MISNSTQTDKIQTGEDYINSLRGRSLKVYLFGAMVEEPVDHPIIRPSINALAKTYDLAIAAPELASVISPFTGERVSRFLHVCTDAKDLVLQNKMQRKLGMKYYLVQKDISANTMKLLGSKVFETCSEKL